MNERIKELMSQAGIDVEAVENLGEMPTALKFAELIAKEYIQNCRDMFMVGSVSWNLLNEKLEHFGVEE